jgi:3'-phosphoadenosine 5'-phosphosulfate sulfotransferase (PAPS reductase)/FAD synthetase
MYVIPCNYGVESLALIEWMRQQKYTDVHCLYVDTGWSHPDWPDRVKKAEEWVRSIGFDAKTLHPKRTFPELVLEQKKFPTTKFQWCASFLKGLPILEYLDFDLDPEMKATIVLPLRRSAARSLVNLPEFIESSEHYNGRKMWHPLYATTTAEVDALALSCGLLPKALASLAGGRSLECFFCVNCVRVPEPAPAGAVEALRSLENAVGAKLYPIGEGGVSESESSLPSGGEGDKCLESFMRGCGLPFGCSL